MKSIIAPVFRNLKVCVVLFLGLLLSFPLNAQVNNSFKELKGEVVNGETDDVLVFATLTLENTNLSTVTNSDGQFVLKIPRKLEQGRVIVSFLGYRSRFVPLSDFKKERILIQIYPLSTELSEINITSTRDAKTLVRDALEMKKDNYLGDETLMTGFYRESIKKRNKNVSLAEAVVNINKQPYTSFRRDKVALYKSRKSTDYNKLDTIALKLQGGPLNALYADFMKYPEYFLSYESFDNYEFSFGEPTKIKNEVVYVVNFKQKENIIGPLFFGKLYISTTSLALTNARYSLNVEDRDAASELYVKRKPSDTYVYPTEVNYQIDYREKDGLWYYGYSNIFLEFVINWDDKLFNSKYRLNSEMAITNIETIEKSTIKNRDRFKSNTILADEASGFSDPNFWGAYNVIEPDKSIESAIEKIQKQLRSQG